MKKGKEKKKRRRKKTKQMIESCFSIDESQPRWTSRFPIISSDHGLRLINFHGWGNLWIDGARLQRNNDARIEIAPQMFPRPAEAKCFNSSRTIFKYISDVLYANAISRNLPLLFLTVSLFLQKLRDKFRLDIVVKVRLKKFEIKFTIDLSVKFLF